MYTTDMTAHRRLRLDALSLMLLMVAVPLLAEERSSSAGGSGYELSTATGLGLLYGASLELVYKNSLSEKLLSELYWPLQPLTYWSSTLYFECKGNEYGLFGSLGLKSGLYSYTGTMTDKDWTTSSGQYTHFSAHDCYTERALLMDLTLGLQSRLSASIGFYYLVSLSAMDFFWTARDGYLKYPPGYIETAVYGIGISYEQLWLSLSYGIGFEWTISKRFGLAAMVLVKPMVIAIDEDKHLFRLEQFNETLYGAFGVDPSVSLKLSLTEWLSAQVDLSYRGLWGARGDTAHTEMGSEALIGIYENGAGAAYNAVDIRISLVSRL